MAGFVWRDFPHEVSFGKPNIVTSGGMEWRDEVLRPRVVFAPRTRSNGGSKLGFGLEGRTSRER